MYLKKQKKSERGFSVAPLLASLVLLGAFGNMMVSYLGEQHRGLSRIRVLASRDRLGNRLGRIVGMKDAIRSSFENASADSPISICLSELGSNDCTAGAANSFDLRNPSAIVMAGDPTFNAVYYSNEGAPCTTPSNLCPFIATSSFEAFCNNGAAECDVAQQLKVTVNVALADYPDQKIHFASVSKSYDYEVKELLAEPETCSGGEVLVGYSAGGSVVCAPPLSWLHWWL